MGCTNSDEFTMCVVCLIHVSISESIRFDSTWTHTYECEIITYQWQSSAERLEYLALQSSTVLVKTADADYLLINRSRRIRLHWHIFRCRCHRVTRAIIVTTPESRSMAIYEHLRNNTTTVHWTTADSTQTTIPLGSHDIDISIVDI